MSGFKELGIGEGYIKSLKELGIKTPTEIQKRTIPLLLSQETDVVAQAQTGSGKTAAFGLPLLESVDSNKKHVQAVILAPTRELAQQIGKQLFKFTKYLDRKIFSEVVYGGESIGIQIDKLRRPTQIIVGTPGRIIDLVNKKALDITKAKCLVLDEADEMLSRGFKDDIEKIFSFISKERKTWLFSATIPKQLEEVIADNLAKKAVRVQIERKKVINENIKHSYVRCEVDDKVKILISYIKAHQKERGVVFARTKEGTKKLAHILQTKNISCDAIHGDLLQKERDKALRKYKKDDFKVLIATDVAARGIDIDDIAYVVHFQLPEISENYVHRSGRTARAGKKGEAIALVADSERNQLDSLSSKYGIQFEEIK